MTPRQIKQRARNAVITAQRRGLLERQHCEACGKGSEHPPGTYDYLKNIHAHHDDYSKPLEVRWLCGSCHKRHHIKHGPGKMPPDFLQERRAA